MASLNHSHRKRHRCKALSQTSSNWTRFPNSSCLKCSCRARKPQHCRRWLQSVTVTMPTILSCSRSIHKFRRVQRSRSTYRCSLQLMLISNSSLIIKRLSMPLLIYTWMLKMRKITTVLNAISIITITRTSQKAIWRSHRRLRHLKMLRTRSARKPT